MEILKHGVLPEDVKYNIECRICDTIFVFTLREAKQVYDPRDGNFITVCCPFCRHTVNIANKILPSLIHGSK